MATGEMICYLVFSSYIVNETKLAKHEGSIYLLSTFGYFHSTKFKK